MTGDERSTLGKLPAAAFGSLHLPEIRPATLDAYRALPDLTGMVSDAMDLVGIDGAVGMNELAPSIPGRRVVGPALTVLNRRRGDDAWAAAKARDNRLADIEAHNLARPGDVLVVQGVQGISSMGGIMAAIAARQDEAGLIVDGAVRDLESSRGLGLAIWSRGASPVTGKWRLETIGINVAVEICGVTVRPGDLVVADDTGVCFVPHAKIDDVLAAALSVAENEQRRQKLIADGASVPDLFAAAQTKTEPER